MAVPQISLSHSGGPIKGSVTLTGSKSISNRALILNALAKQPSQIDNLSSAQDTQILQTLLQDKPEVWNAHHAGTTSRFLMAYLSLQCGTQTLTGSERLQQRPMGELVEALRTIGADISYLGQSDCLPLRIGEFLYQKTKTITVRADISSQFLSALCMIGPKLKHGLEIRLEGEMVSTPYLEMTLEMMRRFGAKVNMTEDRITIPAGNYISKAVEVESDRSSAGYFFSIAALADDAEIELKHFHNPSLQPDSRLMEWAPHFGVTCEQSRSSLLLRSNKKHRAELELDLIDCPDLTQTIAVMAAAKGMKIKYKGLKTLAGKETDRVDALQMELAKVGVRLEEWPGPEFEYYQRGKAKIKSPLFSTYTDHRMALSFAPLALLAPIRIADPAVVDKSFPEYWGELMRLGFRVEN